MPLGDGAFCMGEQMGKLKLELDDYRELVRRGKAGHFLGLPLLEMSRLDLLAVIAYERRAAEFPPKVDDDE